MDPIREQFLETSRSYFAARPQIPPQQRVRARQLRREARQFPQSAAVRAAITLLRRCPI